MCNLKICPVCGYDQLKEAPFDSFGYPSYEICSCCGYEYGFDDESEGISFNEYREEWIKKGFKYRDQEEKPQDWDKDMMLEQLKNIKKVNYKSRYVMGEDG